MLGFKIEQAEKTACTKAQRNIVSAKGRIKEAVMEKKKTNKPLKGKGKYDYICALLRLL